MVTARAAAAGGEPRTVPGSAAKDTAQCGRLPEEFWREVALVRELSGTDLPSLGD